MSSIMTFQKNIPLPPDNRNLKDITRERPYSIEHENSTHRFLISDSLV